MPHYGRDSELLAGIPKPSPACFVLNGDGFFILNHQRTSEKINKVRLHTGLLCPTATQW